MIAAEDETCGGVVINQTNVTCPEVVACLPFATPAETVSGTSTTTIVNPADLYARENITAQTGLGLVLSAIPAPTASQSNWGVNTLGETLHYAPGLGWKIVANLAGFTLPAYANVPGNAVTNTLNIVAPRAGRMSVNAYITALSSGTGASVNIIAAVINKGAIRFAQSAESGVVNGIDANASGTFDVNAGDVINISYLCGVLAGARTLYSWQYEA